MQNTRKVLAFMLALCMVIGCSLTVQAKTHYVAKSEMEKTTYISQNFEALTFVQDANTPTSVSGGDQNDIGGRWFREKSAVTDPDLIVDQNGNKVFGLYRDDAAGNKAASVSVLKSVAAGEAFTVSYDYYSAAGGDVTLLMNGQYLFRFVAGGNIRLFNNGTFSSVVEMVAPVEQWINFRIDVAQDGTFTLTMTDAAGNKTVAANKGSISNTIAYNIIKFNNNSKVGLTGYVDNLQLFTEERVMDKPMEESVYLAQDFNDATMFNNDLLEGKTGSAYVYSGGVSGAHWVLVPELVTVAQRAEGDQCIQVRRLATDGGAQFTGGSATTLPAESTATYSWSFDLKTVSGTFMTLSLGKVSSNNNDVTFIIESGSIQCAEDKTAIVKFDTDQWVTVKITVDRKSKIGTIAVGDASATFMVEQIGTYDAGRFSVNGRGSKDNNYCYVDNISFAEHKPVIVRNYEPIMVQDFEDTTLFNTSNTTTSVGTAGTLAGKWHTTGTYAITPSTVQTCGSQSFALQRNGAAQLHGTLGAALAKDDEFEVSFKMYRPDTMSFTFTMSEVSFHAVNDGRLKISDNTDGYDIVTNFKVPADQWIDVKIVSDRANGNYTITLTKADGTVVGSATSALYAEGSCQRLTFNAQASSNGALGSTAYDAGYIDDIKLQIAQPRYDTLAQALAAAASGEQVKLTADHTEQQITVPAGVTLDLNGYALNTDALVNFGTVMDSSDGKGILKANSIVIGQCDGLALYDSAAGGYRIFAYTLNTMPARSGGESVTFGFALKFANPAAYDLMEQLDVQAKLAWDGMEAEPLAFSFSKELKDQYADMISKYPGMTVVMMLKVSGMDSLSSGTQVRVTPVIENDLGTVVTGEDICYITA